MKQEQSVLVEDDESYEQGVDTRRVGGIRLNTDANYIAQRKRMTQVTEPGTCKGRCLYRVWQFWKLLLWFEPIWQALVVIFVTSGTFYSSQLEADTLETSMWLSCLSGFITFLVLLLIWHLTFRYGAFTDDISKKHLRNELSGAVWIGYGMNLLFLGLSIWMLAKINAYCQDKAKTGCDLKGAFIST